MDFLDKVILAGIAVPVISMAFFGAVWAVGRSLLFFVEKTGCRERAQDCEGGIGSIGR
ncbi:MAG: hypothetical protein IJJ33_13620 [Victivallales bacterium]|nr:hypothetical protein [Victivallales bacterium]